MIKLLSKTTTRYFNWSLSNVSQTKARIEREDLSLDRSATVNLYTTVMLVLDKVSIESEDFWVAGWDSHCRFAIVNFSVEDWPDNSWYLTLWN